MKNMKKLALIACCLMPLSLAASEATYPLERMEPDLRDQASLQSGARTYLNYCHGCHSLKYQRFLRTAEDLGIPENLMLEHLVFEPSTRIGDLMENSISVDSAKNWFGAPPPDLTLYTQLKGGPDFLYTYLKTFYLDGSRPFGVNNLVFENVGMPHVLAPLQGLMRLAGGGKTLAEACRQVPQLGPHGGEMRDPLTSEYVTEEKCGHELIARGYSPLEPVEGTGTLTAEEYDKVVYDLTNFMYYVSEPVRLERQRIGVFVLLFLAFFFVPAYLLGREYH